MCPAFVRTNIVKNSLGGDASDNPRIRALDAEVQRQGADPDALARRILRAIERNHACVLPPFWARVLVAIGFFCPWAGERINRALFRRMVKMGLYE